MFESRKFITKDFIFEGDYDSFVPKDILSDSIFEDMLVHDKPLSTREDKINFQIRINKMTADKVIHRLVNNYSLLPYEALILNNQPDEIEL